MISQFFVLSGRGDTIISRDCKLILNLFYSQARLRRKTHCRNLLQEGQDLKGRRSTTVLCKALYLTLKIECRWYQLLLHQEVRYLLPDYLKVQRFSFLCDGDHVQNDKGFQRLLWNSKRREHQEKLRVDLRDNR